MYSLGFLEIELRTKEGSQSCSGRWYSVVGAKSALVTQLSKDPFSLEFSHFFTDFVDVGPSLLNFLSIFGRP